MIEKCFVCGRPLRNKTLVDTRDGQLVYVGPDCAKHVEDAGEAGYQPPLGGPKLFTIKAEAGDVQK